MRRGVGSGRTERNDHLPRLELVVGEEIICVPQEAWTLEGFRKWAISPEFPERGRITFIAGDLIIDTSPEEPETHIKVKYEFARRLMDLNDREDLGEFYGDGLLVTNEAAELSCEPDGTFVLSETLASGRAVLVPREGAAGQYTELLGTPDLVLEVVSKFSVNKDYQRLRQAYHRAGVPEYWLVNARGKQVEFVILHHRPDGYGERTLRGGWQRSDVLRHDLRLIRERNQRGLWRYTVEMRKR
ncbi:MAG: Uma2 family endonuclease [Gemmatales bacterium]|nr:Uma2 family endonuclease [Gemmatales bacterium]MDW8386177.1 Uma2 family endonuclease [Gemmatales bacterium]